jgi:hypothetical protein
MSKLALWEVMAFFWLAFCFVLFCFAEMAWHGLGMEDTTDWAGIWEWCLASIDY